MNTQGRFNLITRNTEEILTKEDLKNLLQAGEPLRHYIGFEISGKIHLGTGIMCMSKVKDFIEAGVSCTILLADWHTWLNNKLGGDMETIRRVAVGYFKEGMAASLKCVGGDSGQVKFLLGSDLYQSKEGYWESFVDVCKNITLSRIRRSVDIMGRKQEEAVDFAHLLYPPMQVTDIFFQGVNLAHGGMEQRKAHVIMRDVALKMKVSPVRNSKGVVIKPIAVHHHLLLGLAKPPLWPVPKECLRDLWVEMKMSKSVPKACVFIHDSEDEVREKVRAAFCPPKEVEFNPLLDWAKHLIFQLPIFNFQLPVKRAQRYGGAKTYKTYKELEEEYQSGKLHPEDLKEAVAEAVIALLEPARTHFEKPKPKKMLSELEKLAITR